MVIASVGAFWGVRNLRDGKKVVPLRGKRKDWTTKTQISS